MSTEDANMADSAANGDQTDSVTQSETVTPHAGRNDGLYKDDGSHKDDASELVIHVRDCTVSFGDLSVFDGVDLDVSAGTFVGLVGPNGAGKTTLLRAIKGTLNPDAGDIHLAGRSVETLSAKQIGRRVASVPQETSLSFDFPVRNVVEMGRTPYLSRFGSHDATDASAVRDAMAATDVTRFADRPITELSGGERGRVLLARALAQETPALLLDEPTASLDVTHAVRTLELVRMLVNDGKAAIAAIHDLELAARYCDELVLLADGEVHAAGPPEAVLTATSLRETFSAEAFVGTNPATGHPSVTTYPASGVEPRRVHIVGTGPPAARVISRIAAAGHECSVGIVCTGDIAERAAVDADANTVTVPPFESVGGDSAAVEAAQSFARTADATLVIGKPGAPNEAVAAAGTTLIEIDHDDVDQCLDLIAEATTD